MTSNAHSTHTVLATRRIPGRGPKILEDSEFPALVHESPDGPTRGEFLSLLQPCKGLLSLLSDSIDAEALDTAPNLVVVSNYAVGFDNVDVEAATKRGIVVTNTPDVLTDATAEIALSLLFATARRVVESDRFVRRGEFQGWRPTLFLGVDVKGKTLGIVGAGRIGKSLARRAVPLVKRILYTGRTRQPDFEKETGALRVSLNDLLKESDFVSLHVPLTTETRGLIGSDELALMKRSAILINTARGPVVDEKALADALASDRLRAAGLDVYEREPKVDPALLELDNVVLLPHVGSATVETREAMGLLAVTNLLDALRGKRPQYMVNPEVWPPRGNLKFQTPNPNS
ncbi:MAG: 2-hydroxyacid dehydrogenase [Planctomycetota bacterium]|jgi:glyoxylate reductase